MHRDQWAYVAVLTVVAGAIAAVLIVANRGPKGGVVRSGNVSAPSSIPMHFVPTQVAPTVTTIPAGAPPAHSAGQATPPSGTDGCPGAATQAVSKALMLTIGAASQNFTQPCYFATAGTILSVTLINQARNSATNLTPPISVSVLPTPTAASRSVNGITETPLPSLAESIFNSPTALGDTPVQFSLGPLPAGRYELRINPATALPGSVLTVR